MLHDCVFAGPVNTVRADLGTAAEELVADRAGLLLISCVALTLTLTPHTMEPDDRLDCAATAEAVTVTVPADMPSPGAGPSSESVSALSSSSESSSSHGLHCLVPLPVPVTGPEPDADPVQGLGAKQEVGGMQPGKDGSSQVKSLVAIQPA